MHLWQSGRLQSTHNTFSCVDIVGSNPTGCNNLTYLILSIFVIEIL